MAFNWDRYRVGAGFVNLPLATLVMTLALPSWLALNAPFSPLAVSSQSKALSVNCIHRIATLV
ncbi:hypothetical protein ACNKHR_13595 [Shigella flexneri]